MAKSKRRARELARQRYLRQQAKRETARRRRRTRIQIVASVVAVLLVAGGIWVLSGQLGDDGGESVASESTPAPTPTASPGAGECAYTQSGEPSRQVEVPIYDAAKAAEPFAATLKTNRGDITFTALTDKAPCTTWSFRHLAESDFLDDSSCHRVVDSEDQAEAKGLHVVQCGDPSGTGSGGPGYTIPDENLEGATYAAGTLAMANSGQPNSGGSQFFVVFQDSGLDPKYTPFGTITEGLEVATEVGTGGNDGSSPAGGGAPTLALTIEDVVVTPTK